MKGAVAHRGGGIDRRDAHVVAQVGDVPVEERPVSAHPSGVVDDAHSLGAEFDRRRARGVVQQEVQRRIEPQARVNAHHVHACRGGLGLRNVLAGTQQVGDDIHLADVVARACRLRVVAEPGHVQRVSTQSLSVHAICKKPVTPGTHADDAALRRPGDTVLHPGRSTRQPRRHNLDLPRNEVGELHGAPHNNGAVRGRLDFEVGAHATTL